MDAVKHTLEGLLTAHEYENAIRELLSFVTSEERVNEPATAQIHEFWTSMAVQLPSARLLGLLGRMIPSPHESSTTTKLSPVILSLLPPTVALLQSTQHSRVDAKFLSDKQTNELDQEREDGDYVAISTIRTFVLNRLYGTDSTDMRAFTSNNLSTIVSLLRDFTENDGKTNSIEMNMVQQVMEKVCLNLEHLATAQLPEVIHQLFLVSVHPTLKAALVEQVTELLEAPEDGDETKRLWSRAETQVRGTILLNYHFSATQDAQWCPLLLNLLHTRQVSLGPFSAGCLLSMARLHKYKGKVLDWLFKYAQESWVYTHMKQSSAWLHHVLRRPKSTSLPHEPSVFQSFRKVLLRVIRYGRYGWDHLLPSLVSLAFMFLDVKCPASFQSIDPGYFDDEHVEYQLEAAAEHTRMTLSSEAEFLVTIGYGFLVEIFRANDFARPEIVEQLLTRIVTSQGHAPAACVLQALVADSPRSFPQYVPRLKESLSYLPFLSFQNGTAFLRALSPIISLVSDFRDSVIISLRKCMFAHAMTARLLAVYGFLYFLDNKDGASTRNTTEFRLSQHSQSTSSSSSSCSSSRSHHSGGNNDVLNAFGGFVRRAMNQELEIRRFIYVHLPAVVEHHHSNLLSLVCKHIQQFIPSQPVDNIMFRIDACIKKLPHTLEPVGHLLHLVHECILSTPSDSPQMALVAEQMTKLTTYKYDLYHVDEKDNHRSLKLLLLDALVCSLADAALLDRNRVVDERHMIIFSKLMAAHFRLEKHNESMTGKTKKKSVKKKPKKKPKKKRKKNSHEDHSDDSMQQDNDEGGEDEEEEEEEEEDDHEDDVESKERQKQTSKQLRELREKGSLYAPTRRSISCLLHVILASDSDETTFRWSEDTETISVTSKAASMVSLDLRIYILKSASQFLRVISASFASAHINAKEVEDSLMQVAPLMTAACIQQLFTFQYGSVRTSPYISELSLQLLCDLFELVASSAALFPNTRLALWHKICDIMRGANTSVELPLVGVVIRTLERVESLYEFTRKVRARLINTQQVVSVSEDVDTVKRCGTRMGFMSELLVLVARILTSRDDLEEKDRAIQYTFAVKQFTTSTMIQTKTVLGMLQLAHMFSSRRDIMQFTLELTNAYMMLVGCIEENNPDAIDMNDEDDRFAMLNDKTSDVVMKHAVTVLIDEINTMEWFIKHLSYFPSDSLDSHMSKMSVRLHSTQVICNDLMRCQFSLKVMPAVLKMVVKLFKTVEMFAKYMAKDKRTAPCVQFQTLIQVMAKDLTPTCHKTILYVQDTLCVRTKSSSEENVIPKLAAAMEALQMQIFKLDQAVGKVMGGDTHLLSRLFKRSAARGIQFTAVKDIAKKGQKKKNSTVPHPSQLSSSSAASTVTMTAGSSRRGDEDEEASIPSKKKKKKKKKSKKHNEALKDRSSNIAPSMDNTTITTTGEDDFIIL